jgi:hypothetical protein
MSENQPCQARIRLRLRRVRAGDRAGCIAKLALSCELIDPPEVVAYSPSRLHPRIALTRTGAVRG